MWEVIRREYKLNNEGSAFECVADAGGHGSAWVERATVPLVYFVLSNGGVELAGVWMDKVKASEDIDYLNSVETSLNLREASRFLKQ